MKFKDVVKTTFVLASGVYVGLWLAGILVVAPVKAIDNVLAKKLKNWTENMEGKIEEAAKEDMEDSENE